MSAGDSPDQTRDERCMRMLTAHDGAIRRLAASYERDPSRRQDLVQDIWLAVWQALPRFRNDCSERTFIFRIAHNRAVSHIEHWQRRRRTGLQNPVHLQSESRMTLKAMRGMLSLLAGRLGRPATGSRQPLDPGIEFMFQRAQFGKLPTEEIREVGAPARARACRRLDRVESAFAEIQELRLELPSRSWFSATGTRTDRYSVVLWVETDSDDRTNAFVERAEFRRNGSTYALDVPEDLLAERPVFRWEVTGPHDQPVTITGPDANIGVYDMTGPVAISAGQGQVSVLDSSGPTDVSAAPTAYAVWAGCRGPVRIHADLDVWLKVTDLTFDGLLHATSKQSIHLLLPPGFRGGIEATVADDAALVCGADLTPMPMQRRKKHGRLVVTYGAGATQLRLISQHGRIVIDNSRRDARVR